MNFVIIESFQFMPVESKQNNKRMDNNTEMNKLAVFH